MKVSNWGNYPRVEAKVIDEPKAAKGAFICRGYGRSYGDASLSDQILDTSTTQGDIQIVDGHLEAEAGLSLKDVLDHIVPKGYFLPVSPGTKYVSLGGAVAFDIHGKNHHKEGSFGQKLLWLELENSNGDILRCSDKEHSQLFYDSIGGMGLTGIIRKVGLELKAIKSSLIDQERKSFSNLDETLEAFEKYGKRDYSVAWIDCTSSGSSFGRSILFLGTHSEQGELKVHGGKNLSIPFYFPSFSLNKFSIRAFNELYFLKNKTHQKALVNYDKFFYPLDSILHWNRIYGKNGFTQYQFVVPKKDGKRALKKIIEYIQKKRVYPFLTVLKEFGEGNSKSLLSFPMAGYTLALDFKIRPGLFDFLNELDEIVMKYEGRIYLAKDCRLPKEHFKQMYPKVDKSFGDTAYSSFLAKRIGLR